MTHATLFSGIGAAEIAAQSLGWTNLFNCDNNEFSQRVLKYHFPDAKQYGDIQAANFTVWRNRVDVLTGGFPCQPFSQAGKRLGTDDERYLWREFLRVIEEVQPRWVVGENVLGIVTWSKGLVFEQVCSDLEAKGYDVTSYILPAAGVGAPHQRYRVFFVAYNQSFGRNKRGTNSVRQTDSQAQRSSVCEFDSRPFEVGTFAYTDSNRCREWTNKQKYISGVSRTSNYCTCCKDGAAPNAQNPRFSPRTQRQEQVQSWGRDERIEFSDNWSNFPTQPPVCSRDDGFFARLDTKAILNGKRLTKAKWREESIKAYGNAIVPQVLQKIYQAIENYETINKLNK